MNANRMINAYKSDVRASAHCVTVIIIAVLCAFILAGCKSTTTIVKDKFAYTCAFGTASEVEAMIRTDPALVNSRTKSGTFPLHDAATFGNVKAIEILIKHGARINARDSIGNSTPLQDAVSTKQIEAVRYLIKAGADLNIADNCHETALFIAVITNDFKIVKLLVDAGANVNVSDSRDGIMTPLFIAKCHNNKQLIAYLKQHGAKSKY